MANEPATTPSDSTNQPPEPGQEKNAEPIGFAAMLEKNHPNLFAADVDQRHAAIEARRRELAEAREAAERREHWHGLQKSLGVRYADCTLDGFRVYDAAQKPVLAALSEYGANLPTRVSSGEGLVLMGKPGTGKDHLLAALMRTAVCDHGIKVHWVNGQDFYGRVRDRIDATNGNQSESALLAELTAPPVLVISDPVPPVGPLSPFQMATLFRIIDGRYRNCKATWITVNVTSDQEASERMGSAVVDRLTDGCTILWCGWESFRKLSAR